MIFWPFAAILIAAAIFDLRTLTIPNWLCLFLVVAFVSAAMITHMPIAALSAQIACGLAVLAATFLLFLIGVVGGGDAKLADAIALWLGWDGLTVFLVQTALWGGALAALILLIRELSFHLIIINHRLISNLVDPAAGAPYGVALAIGGLFALPHSALWRLAGAA